MNKEKYDYLIVGVGLFGTVFVYEASRKQKSVELQKKETILVRIFI